MLNRVIFCNRFKKTSILKSYLNKNEPTTTTIHFKHIQSQITNGKDQANEEINKTPIEKVQEKIKQEELTKEINKFLNEKDSWVYSMPKYIQPYLRLMRLDKPIGTYVVMWPGIWSILGAASYQQHYMPDYTMLGIFVLGAITMRSAGCIINDIWDRNFDKSVERTKHRPLASGEISLLGALGLLGINLSASLSLLLQLDLTTQILGACALFPTILYPATKRFSDFPQFYLGLAINWGALMGWSAIMSQSPETQNIFAFIPGLICYLACINWTLVYDTIYAYQDKLFDQKLGLRSTAITFEKHPKKWLLLFSSLSVTNLALFGYLTHQEPIYYASTALVFLHFLKQILCVNLNSAKSCGEQFKSNNTIGILVSLGLIMSNLTH